jgi:hypothetical protein
MLLNVWSLNNAAAERAGLRCDLLSATARGDSSLSNLNNPTYCTFSNEPQGRGSFTLHPPYTSLFLDEGRMYDHCCIPMRKCPLWHVTAASLYKPFHTYSSWQSSTVPLCERLQGVDTGNAFWGGTGFRYPADVLFLWRFWCVYGVHISVFIHMYKINTPRRPHFSI